MWSFTTPSGETQRPKRATGSKYCSWAGTRFYWLSIISKFALLMSKMEGTWKHSKILLMDFSSTALCNIFMLNKKWVYLFDVSQLPLKTAVWLVTSLSSLLIHMQHKHIYLHKYFLFQWSSNKKNISKGSECSKEVDIHINTCRTKNIMQLNSGKPKSIFSFIILPLVGKNFSHCALLSWIVLTVFVCLVICFCA